jgi:hypothetical protein
MMNLHYEIRICQKIYNRVTTHNKSKCLVRNSLHQTLWPLEKKYWLCISTAALKCAATVWKPHKPYILQIISQTMWYSLASWNFIICFSLKCSYCPRIAQFYIQLVFKAPLCITLTISDQKIVSGSLFLTEKKFFQKFFQKKKTFF